jgi:DNA recombination protein RmuC
VGLLSKDINRLDERVENLQKHFNASTEDIKKIRISTEKITKRADKIENVDVNLRDNLDPDIEKGSLPNLK